MINHGINPCLPRLGGLIVVLVLTGSVFVAEARAAESPIVPDLAGKDLTLDAAIALALEHNPELMSYSAAADEAMARADQIGRRPNPELGFQMENFAGSGDWRGLGAAEYTLMLSQKFELGAKRARTKDVADYGVVIAHLDAELGARKITARVTKVFMATLAAQTDVALTEELAGLAVQDLDFVKRQVEQGTVSPVEVNRARLAASAAEMAAEVARGGLQARRLQLAVLWNSQNPAFGEVLGEWDNVAPVPEWTELSARLTASPELKLWDAEADRRRAEVTAATAQGKIDLTAAAGIRHFAHSGDNALVAELSIPLQTSDRNQDGTRAAQFGLDRLGAARQAQYVEMLGELVRHYEQLAISHDQIVTMREEILPLAEQSMAEVNAAYRKGLFSLTDVMATRRTWFEAQGSYFDALVRYQEATVDIDLLVGDTLSNAPVTQEKD